MRRFTVEEINLLSIFADKNKKSVIANMKVTMPFMDTNMRELTLKTIEKLNKIPDKDFSNLEFFPAKECR